MTPQQDPTPEEHRLEAALDRIAAASARLRPAPGGAADAGSGDAAGATLSGPVQGALLRRVDALIAELRGVLGTEA